MFVIIIYFLEFQIEGLTNSSTSSQVVSALEKVAYATKGPSGNDSLTDGELTTVSKSLESVANLLNKSKGLVSNDFAEVCWCNDICNSSS